MSRQARPTRRDVLFGRLGAAVRRVGPKQGDELKRAVIQGRHCLAYRELMCSTCYERCPEEGAIVMDRGIPSVVADRCTGCGDCQGVCPAPVNAVLMIRAQPVIQRSKP